MLILRELSFMAKEVYNEYAFIPHAASRHQSFLHCVRFPVAATRRCMGRVSVPFCPSILSDRVPVVGLVGFYPTNYLMGSKLLNRRAVMRFHPEILCSISLSFDKVFSTKGKILTYYSAVRNFPDIAIGIVLLACLKHAASVRPGPGSNPQKRNISFQIILNKFKTISVTYVYLTSSIL